MVFTRANKMLSDRWILLEDSHYFEVAIAFNQVNMIFALTNYVEKCVVHTSMVAVNKQKQMYHQPRLASEDVAVITLQIGLNLES